MITTKRNGQTYIKCGRCKRYVKPRNGSSDIRILQEGNAEYYCEECANLISGEDGDSCMFCHYKFVQDEIRFTFQLHSTINVKKLYKKEELCAAGNICERCRRLLEKVVLFNN